MLDIIIADQFTPYPGGRYLEDGPGNGSKFRNDFLIPILDRGETANIILDGAQGYPSSFLEEVFGGLVRLGYLPDQIKSAFEIVANDPGFARYKSLIDEYIDRAAAQVAH